jgi:N-acetylglucosaminyl-diphospho-decaprenol L-rhamnosyltransferase
VVTGTGPAAPSVSVVMITRNRCAAARRSVERLLALPENPPVIVVDNASTDGTVAALDSEFGDRVDVIAMDRNAGAAGRNAGVRAATSRFVAFADDDSAWLPGALRLAAAHLDGHPRLAVLAARVLLGPNEEVDPTCEAMAASPLPRRDGLPGPSVLGFIACGAVVRREAFLAAGGFDERYGVGGEEGPLAIELAMRGWDLAYLDDVTALHWPSPVRNRSARRRTLIRNELWLAWHRRHWSTAARTSARLVRLAVTDEVVRAGLWEAARAAPGVLLHRRRIDDDLERQLRLLDGSIDPPVVRSGLQS